MKLRKLALILHRYVGVIFGLLILVIGLTGSALVFHEEIDRALNSHLHQVVPQGELASESLRDRISPDSALQIVRSAYPDLTLSYIDLPRKPDSVYTVGMESKKDEFIYAYVNPYTGAILGTQQWGRTLMTFVYDIHFSLLAGKVGEKVVGICGLLLLLLSVSGMILWSGWRRLLSGFQIRWQAPWQLVNYDLHKVGGIVSAVFLLLIASTGAAMIFHAETEPAIYWLTQTPQPTPLTSTPQVGKSPLTLAEILPKADAALPEGKTTFISLASKPDGIVRVTKKLPQEIRPDGRSRVYLDQYSGKVLRVENALTVPLGTRIMNELFTLHIGIYGGLGMRILYVFAGLTPTVLFITGFVMWRQRQWAIARRQEAIRQSQGIPEPRPKIYPTTEVPWI
ncbi:PepSY domain-containing protein [Trichocoleus sp. Lan]|uniref:PepSY-associated TM helix domain-containing protein n=1 Tax=Cyanophyceae TaxID=3028117 RepID=UPI0016824A2C|nr:PepSY-associated TM helix domain-containing protein [Coleofasciculus sp. FACHB-542]MBD2084363.1 PepSY domain-containing protein [Coleofasciculus sp. FACHB-542]